MTFAGHHHSEEVRAKISAARSGTHASPETCAKMSATRTGRPSNWLGHHHSDETKAKLSALRSGIATYRPGYTHSAETRAKLSAATRGKPKPHAGHPVTPETRAKIAATMTGKPHPCSRHSRGHTPESRAKIFATLLNHTVTPETLAKISGENGSNWRGGISFEPYCPKWNDDLRRRIRAAFDHRCLMCGKPQAEERRLLSCHHVEYRKTACCDGKPVQFASLCCRHHNMTTNGDRQRWENMLHRVIDEVYEGRSYLPRPS